MIHRKHLHNVVRALKYIHKMPDVSAGELACKAVELPMWSNLKGRKLLVFSLDETLVHCCRSPSAGHFKVDIPMPDGDTMQAGVAVRPFARECLQTAARLYEVAIFSASPKAYVDAVIDQLDPTGELVHHRLYYNHCVEVLGVLVKDLRIFQTRKLEEIVIVDSSPLSFAFQIDNGIPIISWTGDRMDRELLNL
jgi:CTD small phosphatase-like protein 2